MGQFLKHLQRLGKTFVLITASASYGQTATTAPNNTADLSKAQTVAFCEVLDQSEAFNNKLIRVRALYETDFERSALTAPSCATPIPMTWVDFDKNWEHRTRWRVRRAISGQPWRLQTDVVFIGIFRSDGHFGHMDAYPFLFEVYKVEAIRPTGSFRPLPEGKSN